MSITLKNIKIPYPTEGVIRSAQLNDTVTPENSVQLAINMNFDRVGAIQTRPGVSADITSLSGSVKAFGTLNILSGSQSLFGQVGTDVSVWNGAIWTSVRTLGTGVYKARFSQFLNRTWMVNGNGGDAVQTSNGGAFSTTDVPATFPKGDFIQAGFDGRVWVADASKDALYYTDIVQFNGTAYTSPLTFTLSTNFIEWLSPEDGESITGLFRVPKALLVFKQNHIYRVYNTDNVDAYPAYNVGTYSQESIIQAKDGLYFHHSSGFYKFAYDGQPIEISRRILDFVKAISRSNYGNVVGVYDGFDNVEWAVGSVTVEGVTYTNCVLRYSISTQVWTVYDYPGNTITAMIRFDNGTVIRSLMGTSTGKVGTLDSGNDDFGSAIYFEMIDRWRSFTEMYSKSKSVSGIMVSAQNGGGALLQYQTEKAPENVWTDIDTLDQNYNSLFPNANTDDFNIIRFRLRGNTSGTPIIISGIELLSIQDKGLNQN
jgi:hypothetical protein